MIRRPPRSTRTDTLFPYTTLFRSQCRAILRSKCGAIRCPLSVNLRYFTMPPEYQIRSKTEHTIPSAHRAALYRLHQEIASLGLDQLSACRTCRLRVSDLPTQYQRWPAFIEQLPAHLTRATPT